MNANFLIALREGLEVSLVIGFLLISLVQNKKQHLIKTVLFGTLFGIIFSILAGIILFITFGGLENTVKEYIEGGIQLVAAILIFYFIVWLSSQSNHDISEQLKSEIRFKDNSISLFLMASIFVIREGLELVLFVLSNSDTHSTRSILSIFLGIIAAIAITYALIKTTTNLNIKFIFTLLGILLIFFGGKVFTEGLFQLIDAPSIFENIAFYGYVIFSLLVLFKKNLISFSHRNN
ncbi:FTR1 family protein [Bacillus sp. EAC]|uniref:FTR1 family protein n=1 Tax=Bacillus sp. EAC TaxID=1978338 RepID=UPI000B453B0B|nr:FTR1 family protein [Bacillus sp. EAC]